MEESPNGSQSPETTGEEPSWQQALERFDIPSDEWESAIRAMEAVGLTPQKFISSAIAWSSLVEPGKEFPGIQPGTEKRIADLLAGERKLDPD